jgi:hypothetical protein
MSPKSKQEYLAEVKPRYQKAALRKKSRILDEFCLTYHCHRKHAIRILNKPLVPVPKFYNKRGRKPVYGNSSLETVLKRIWLNSNLPCSKNFKAIIPLWIDSYQEEFGLLDKAVVKLALAVSASTIDRILKPLRLKHKKKGLATTKPGTLLRKQIPIKTDQWDETRPGFLETDLVAHCGTAIEGQYAHTVDTVDIATGWNEQRAVWGKGEAGVMEQITDIENSLPFPILGFDSDNGSEFLNHQLMRHFLNRKFPIQFTRSRAYRKNDNAHVEQKNYTQVRQWLGYERFDNPLIVRALNDLYKSEWRFFHNFFIPSVKLISKQRIGSKIVKKHDKPKTPCQRLLESNHMPDHVKKQLQKTLKELNPFKLQKAMRLKIKKVFSLL